MKNLQDLKQYDLMSLQHVIAAYSEFAEGEYLMSGVEEIGFNETNGYVYLPLENGVEIASRWGGSVVYLAWDNNKEEEFEFDTYSEAINYLNTNNDG